MLGYKLTRLVRQIPTQITTDATSGGENRGSVRRSSRDADHVPEPAINQRGCNAGWVACNSKDQISVQLVMIF